MTKTRISPGCQVSAKGRFLLYSNSDFRLTPAELNAPLLLVSPDPNNRSSIRDTLSKLGFRHVISSQDHSQALQSLEQRHIRLVLFSAASTSISAMEFCKRAMRNSPQTMLLPISFNPGIDDVFEMLRAGARGYIVMPYTAESLENSILLALKGKPLSDVLLKASDLNIAFAAIIAGNLDKFTSVEKQMHTLHKPQEYNRYRQQFHISVKTGKLFATGGEDALRESLVEFFIQLAEGPASRLGRLRQQLKNQRKIPQTDSL